MSSFEHALVLSGQNGLYRVETAQGLLLCRSASKIRKNGRKLLAGDFISGEDNGDGTGFIRDMEERKNSLIRPPVANIGLLVLVTAASNPKPDAFLLDKLTVIAEKEGIPAAIAITKSELGGAEKLAAIYRKTPYPVFLISEKGKIGAEALFAHMRGKLSVFCGASGVGKSTLLNFLIPELHANVGTLSEKIQRGKNTTRVTSLHRIGQTTYIADTPGFTMLDTGTCCRIDKAALVSLFPEMKACPGQCRYTHCTHLCEDGCRFLEAVKNGTIAKERHESYLKLYQELNSLNLYKERRTKHEK